MPKHEKFDNALINLVAKVRFRIVNSHQYLSNNPFFY